MASARASRNSKSDSLDGLVKLHTITVMISEFDCIEAMIGMISAMKGEPRFFRAQTLSRKGYKIDIQIGGITPAKAEALVIGFRTIFGVQSARVEHMLMISRQSDASLV